jgi:hypothetical protein
MSEKDVQARFEKTLRNLLAMPPVRQPTLAKRGRRARLLRKIERAELDHLVSLVHALNPENDHDIPGVWDKLSDRILDVFQESATLQAIESCLRELQAYREKHGKLDYTSGDSNG